MCFLKKPVCSFIKSEYIDLIVKVPEVFSFQPNTSEFFVKLTFISPGTKSSQVSHLFRVKALVNSIFSGLPKGT
jgi:hypothetical protein